MPEPSQLVFHERVGLDGRRISPFSWRIRYAFLHKGLEPGIVETRFADVDRIRALSGQHFVPIIEHDGQVVHDSWAIACHLEDAFPDRPSLFGGLMGRGLTRWTNHWAGHVLGASIRRIIAADFVWVIAPEDRAYYRSSREAMFGCSLEQYCADRAGALAAMEEACVPLRVTLAEQPFLCGAAPGYADYATFSLFQYARVGCPDEIIPGVAEVRAWRDRLVAMHGGMGDRFGLYPAQRSGPDGR